MLVKHGFAANPKPLLAAGSGFARKQKVVKWLAAGNHRVERLTLPFIPAGLFGGFLAAGQSGDADAHHFGHRA